MQVSDWRLNEWHCSQQNTGWTGTENSEYQRPQSSTYHLPSTAKKLSHITLLILKHPTREALWLYSFHSGRNWGWRRLRCPRWLANKKCLLSTPMQFYLLVFILSSCGIEFLSWVLWFRTPSCIFCRGGLLGQMHSVSNTLGMNSSWAESSSLLVVWVRAAVSPVAPGGQLQLWGFQIGSGELGMRNKPHRLGVLTSVECGHHSPSEGAHAGLAS